MRQKLGLVVVSLTVMALVTQSCSSSDSDSALSAGSSGTAGRTDSAGRGGGTTSEAGAGGTSSTPAAGAAGELSSGGAAAGAAGMSDSSDGAGAGGTWSVVETSCTDNSDCLPVCNHYGWPKAHCFGYCYCEAENGMPTCTAGTTEGCPPGTQCRGGSGCLPYGTGKDDDPCEVFDACAVGYTCIGYGNPLPNGNSTSCRHLCSADKPLPADCYSCSSGIYCDPHPAGGASGM